MEHKVDDAVNRHVRHNVMSCPEPCAECEGDGCKECDMLGYVLIRYDEEMNYFQDDDYGWA